MHWAEDSGPWCVMASWYKIAAVVTCRLTSRTWCAAASSRILTVSVSWCPKPVATTSTFTPNKCAHSCMATRPLFVYPALTGVAAWKVRSSVCLNVPINSLLVDCWWKAVWLLLSPIINASPRTFLFRRVRWAVLPTARLLKLNHPAAHVQASTHWQGC